MLEKRRDKTGNFEEAPHVLHFANVAKSKQNRSAANERLSDVGCRTNLVHVAAQNVTGKQAKWKVVLHLYYTEFLYASYRPLSNLSSDRSVKIIHSLDTYIKIYELIRIPKVRL